MEPLELLGCIWQFKGFHCNGGIHPRFTVRRTEYMSYNEPTPPITKNQEEAKAIGPLGKKGGATRNGHTISGGLQTWLWGFAVSLPARSKLEPTTKAVELMLSQPTPPPVTHTSLLPRPIGQVRMPRWPLIPGIIKIERPLSGLPLLIQSARDALACPLGWLLLGAFVGSSVLIQTLVKEPATSGLPSERPHKPLPSQREAGQPIYIETQGGWLSMEIGSHVVCNCPIPELNLSLWQVGRITAFCDDVWLEIGFNSNTGPWLQPANHDPNEPVGWPFSLLPPGLDVSVDLSGVRQPARRFDVRNDWRPGGEDYYKRQEDCYNYIYKRKGHH